MAKLGLLLVGMVLLLAACGGDKQSAAEPFLPCGGDGPPREETLGQAYHCVESPQYNLYWLGDRVVTGDYSLEGPSVCGIGCALTSDALESHYYGTHAANLTWSILSVDAWDRERESIENPRNDQLVTTQVEIAGHSTRILQYQPHPEQTRFIRAVITADSKTIILASTDFSPLTDPVAFVKILESFRAYPD